MDEPRTTPEDPTLVDEPAGEPATPSPPPPSTTTVTSGPDPEPSEEATTTDDVPRRRLRASIRTRVLGFAAVLLIGATVLGLFVQRTVLLQRLDRQVNEMLEQERDELESLIGGRNPETGEPFGTDVAAIFETFLNRNVPATDEVFIAYVDGQLYGETLSQFRLGDRPEFAALWTDVTQTERREIETNRGPIRYLAIPLITDGDA